MLIVWILLSALISSVVLSWLFWPIFAAVLMAAIILLCIAGIVAEVALLWPRRRPTREGR